MLPYWWRESWTEHQTVKMTGWLRYGVIMGGSYQTTANGHRCPSVLNCVRACMSVRVRVCVWGGGRYMDALFFLSTYIKSVIWNTTFTKTNYASTLAQEAVGSLCHLIKVTYLGMWCIQRVNRHYDTTAAKKPGKPLTVDIVVVITRHCSDRRTTVTWTDYSSILSCFPGSKVYAR